MKKLKPRHGLSRSKEYRSWAAMIQRCTNPNCEAYHNYGGRGIKVIERWKYFPNFIADIGLKPNKKATIDRKDNTLGYNKNNCRWVSKKRNCQNTRKSKRWVVSGICFLSLREAVKFCSTNDAKTIKNWCDGVTKNGRYYSPKPNCYSYKLYE